MKKILLVLAFTVGLFATHAADIPQARTVCGPWVTNVTDDSFTVVWVSDARSIGWVEIAPTDATSFYAEERARHYEDALGKHIVSTVHHVRIDGLQAGTSYRYRIFQQGIDDSGAIPVLGKVSASDVYSRAAYKIRTFDSAAQECNFTVVNDIHGDNDVLSDLTSAVKDSKTDFVVFNGDMSSFMTSVEQIAKDYMSKAVEAFATDTPLVFVRGNHETRGAASTEFLNLFPTSTSQPYYIFRHGNAAFVVLDCGEDKPDNDIEYGGMAAYDAHREREAAWLKQALQSEEFRSAAVRIAFLHVPPSRGGWHGNIEIMRLFVPLLNEAGIDLMLSGHNHAYSFMKRGERDNDFPVIVNSNVDRLDVKVKGSQIGVNVVDRGGKVIHSHQFDAKR